MPPLVVTARGMFSRVLLPAVLVTCGLLSARAEENTFIDWKKVPQSQAPDRLVNRAFIQWCETNFGAKIDRGECWDVPAKGLPAVGSSWGPGGFDFGRHMDADETPFPGDPLATKDRRHTMVTYRSTGDGKLTILHQNWNWGEESGRTIGWGSGKLEGHDFWRVRPRQGERFEDLLVAARARPRQQRGVTKPRSQPAGAPARDAASKENAAAALAAE